MKSTPHTKKAAQSNERNETKTENEALVVEKTAVTTSHPCYVKRYCRCKHVIKPTVWVLAKTKARKTAASHKT